jgi:hypothetical protein
VVGGVDLHEHRAQALGLGPAEVVADQRFVDDDAQFAAVTEVRMKDARLGGIAVDDVLEGAVLEERPDGTVHPSRAGAELTLLGLQTIELRQDLDRHGDDVLIELEQGLGIVNQYVGVQDVSLFHVLDSVRKPETGNPGNFYFGGSIARR